jgi:hypothetical protein
MEPYIFFLIVVQAHVPSCAKPYTPRYLISDSQCEDKQ